MSNFNKPKTLLVTLLTCAAFSAHAAWWDAWKSAGDDGNVKTKGNAAAATAKSQSAIIYVAIVNNTNTVLGSAVLKDKTGKVLYTSTKGKICAIGDVCRLRVNRNVLNKNTTFFFYDTNNKLTSAYLVKDAPVANAMGYDIDVSMSSLGLYVLNRIQIANPKISYARIDQDIVTTTLQATPYEELADYYLDLLGNSKDDSKVIADLAAQFAENKSIPANPSSVRLVNLKAQRKANLKTLNLLATPTVRSSSDSPMCSKNLTDGLDIFSKLSIPFASQGADLFSKVLDVACPKDNTDQFMADQFAKLSAQLNTMQNTIDATYEKLQAITQQQDKLAATKNQIEVKKLDNQISSWVSNYSTVLAKHNGADGKPRNSLKAIIDSYGSVAKAIKKDPQLDIDLSLVYSNSKSMRDALNDISTGGNINALVKNMQDLCTNGNNIVGGVFQARSSCDLAITTLYAKNVILGAQAKYAYNDVNAVFNEDTRTEIKRTAVWQPILSTEFDDFNTTVNLINPTKIIFNMIEPNDNVYSTVDNLQKAGFKVTEWYSDKSKRYLDVEYSLNGSTIKSKYAYQEPIRKKDESVSYDVKDVVIDSKIINVMGVPVPERFFTGGGKSRNSYGADEAFPWAERTVLASSSGDYHSSDYATADFKNSSGNLIVYADYFTPSIDTRLSKNNDGWTSQEKSKSKNTDGEYVKYDRQIFAKTAPDLYRVKYYAYYDLDVIGTSAFFTYMRYTANDGYSYVWAMRTWIAASDPAVAGRPIYAAPECMTNDCQVINTGEKLDKLQFGIDDAMNFTWNHEGSLEHKTYTLQASK